MTHIYIKSYYNNVLPQQKDDYMQKHTLDKVMIKQQAHIEAIADDKIRSRMLDLGFTKGSVVTPLFESPTSDPVAYRIKNVIIALRNDEAKYVEVTI